MAFGDEFLYTECKNEWKVVTVIAPSRRFDRVRIDGQPLSDCDYLADHDRKVTALSKNILAFG